MDDFQTEPRKVCIGIRVCLSLLSSLRLKVGNNRESPIEHGLWGIITQSGHVLVNWCSLPQSHASEK